MPVHASIKYISIFFLNGHSFFISDYILCIKSFKYFCIFDFITYFTHNSSWVYEVFKYLFVQWIFIPYSMTIHTLYQVFQVFLYVLKWSYIIYTPVHEYIKYLSIFLKLISILYLLTVHTLYHVFQVFLYISKWSYIIHTAVHEYIKYLSMFLLNGYLFFTLWQYILCIKCFKYFCIFRNW